MKTMNDEKKNSQNKVSKHCAICILFLLKIFSLSNFITLMRPLDPDLDNFGAAQEPTKSSLLANG